MNKKKGTAVSLALAAALVSTCALSACKVEYDREAPAFGADADVTISVQAKKTDGYNGKISDTLFGVFLEDINYASYLLDDNLVKNGSFDPVSVTDAKAAWHESNSTMTLQTSGGPLPSAYSDKSVNPNYMKVTITGSNGNIWNEGYGNAMPMYVEKDVQYKFSAFIKSSNAFNLGVKVTDGTDEYLSGSVSVSGGNEWVKYERTFTASDTKKSKSLRLEISAPNGTEFYIDGVALETLDADAVTGIKSKPYNAIKDLGPKFIRFPGGCVIEGNNDKDAYDWKNSVGAVTTGNNAGDDNVPEFTYSLNTESGTSTAHTYGEAITRKANTDIWAGGYYDMTYAIGFYEYFLLCDSLGASAVPVLNCGYSCMARGASPLVGRHSKGIQDFIRDAIDLIEFAKGGTNTKWGKIRADMGHPEPFEMSYLGIGNEQWGTYYASYYEKFLENEAFMNALSTYSVKPIVGNGTQLTDCERPDVNGILSGGLAKAAAESYLSKNNPARRIETVNEYGVVDQHYYVNYTTMLNSTDMYDSYLRPGDDADKYYEVFVGEYSANEANGVQGFNKYTNNQWICALSEAAMMTGYERNGDIIKLAAYAPMFGTAIKFGDSSMANNQWPTDMMYFNDRELVLSTNYYVQQLFMQNQGSYKIADSYHNIKWNNGVMPTFSLKADDGSNITKTVNKLYYVASLAENGDLIIKIVNVSGDKIKADLALSDIKLKGNATVTLLQNEDRAVTNTIEETNISPVSFKLGKFTKQTIGYEVLPYSVTSITVHAK